MNRSDPRASIRYFKTEMIERFGMVTLLVQLMNRGRLVEWYEDHF